MIDSTKGIFLSRKFWCFFNHFNKKDIISRLLLKVSSKQASNSELFLCGLFKEANLDFYYWLQSIYHIIFIMAIKEVAIFSGIFYVYFSNHCLCSLVLGSLPHHQRRTHWCVQKRRSIAQFMDWARSPLYDPIDHHCSFSLTQYH